VEDLTSLETALNAMIAKGEMVEATDRLYADDCVYQERTALAESLLEESNRLRTRPIVEATGTGKP
jgi:hypothetical protein